jgi:hypothetical protein
VAEHTGADIIAAIHHTRDVAQAAHATGAIAAIQRVTDPSCNRRNAAKILDAWCDHHHIPDPDALAEIILPLFDTEEWPGCLHTTGSTP